MDDESDLCHMLQERFEEHFDGKVCTAETWVEIAASLLSFTKSEGILLDVNLRSRLNGFDVLARTAEISPATKVTMVTGVNDFASIEKAMALGAVDYITKPFMVKYFEVTLDAKIATLMYA